MKMREALWSAVACYRFRAGPALAGWPSGGVPNLGQPGRERARRIIAAASYRTLERLRRLGLVFSMRSLPIFIAAAHAAKRHPETMKMTPHPPERERGEGGVGPWEPRAGKV